MSTNRDVHRLRRSALTLLFALCCTAAAQENAFMTDEANDQASRTYAKTVYGTAGEEAVPRYQLVWSLFSLVNHLEEQDAGKGKEMLSRFGVPEAHADAVLSYMQDALVQDSQNSARLITEFCERSNSITTRQEVIDAIQRLHRDFDQHRKGQVARMSEVLPQETVRNILESADRQLRPGWSQLEIDYSAWMDAERLDVAAVLKRYCH